MNRAPAVACLAFTLTLTLAGCRDRDDSLAPHAVRAAGFDGKTTALVVEADRPVDRLVVSIDDELGHREVELLRSEKDGLLAGALDVLPGAKAELGFRAYAAGDKEPTYEGKGTLVVEGDVTPQQEFALAGVPGAEAAAVRIGTYRLALSQQEVVSEPGREVRIEAMLLDAYGEPQALKEGALQWEPAPSQKEIGNAYFDYRDWLIDILWLPEKWYAGRIDLCTKDIRFCGRLTLQDPNPFVQVVTGTWHSCVLRKSGTVRCWGDNSTGQLGKDTSGTSVIGATVFRSISAGSFHSCGVDDGGAVRCWGSNNEGQLGVPGAGTWSAQPNAVALPAAATQVAAGGHHSCAILVNGETWCWGGNWNGQLGDGSAVATPVVNSSATPVKVASAPAFVAISGGFEHTCAITAAGIAWCWGSDSYGQSGFDPATSDRCAVNSAVYPTTWVTCAATPREVQTTSGSWQAPIAFAGIGGGSYSTCAWTPGGTGYCWGMPHGSFPWNGNKSWLPRTPTTQPAWKFLTAATEFQCGIDASDMVECFGDTQHGQTGTGIGLPTLTVANPTAVTVQDAWTSVDGGSQHACGVRSLGFVVSCWGRNDHGQLGHVTPSGLSLVPVNATF